jgi:WD40 repeat protein
MDPPFRRVVVAFFALTLSLHAGPPAPGQPGPVTALAFSPDGANVLVGGFRTVRIHSINGSLRATNWACPFPKLSALTFSPDGRTLGVSGGTSGVDGGILLVDWPQGTRLACFTNHADLATAVAFHPEGRWLVSAGADGLVQLTPFPNREPAIQLKGHSGPVLAAAFSPDGQLVVTAGTDRSIKVWDVSTGKLRRSFNQHTDTVHCLAFRPGSSSTEPGLALCVSGSQDRTVRVWQPGIGRLVRIVRAHEGPVLAVAWNPVQARFYSAGTEGMVRSIDAGSDQILGQWQAHGDWIYSLAVSADGALLATGSWAGAVKVWRVGDKGKENAAPNLVGELKP